MEGAEGQRLLQTSATCGSAKKIEPKKMSAAWQSKVEELMDCWILIIAKNIEKGKENKINNHIFQYLYYQIIYYFETVGKDKGSLL